MFTDMVGYTALTQSSESQALEVLERHNRLLRPFFPKYHGTEVKTIGDSFLVEFDSALDATNCAIEIQRFLHDYNISSRDEWKVTLRIGIHLGDVVQSDGDILGDAVNIASRLQPLADPEGICVSDQVFSQVRNKIPQNLVKLAPQELKNVRFPVDVYKVMMPWEKEGAGEAPQLDSKRIAVLPFANMSPDPQDAYFADGLTEELISTMSKMRELQVISRTSVMQYKDKSKSMEVIGKELKAGTILEGSVRKASSRIRVTIQMIDSNNDLHLWAESYDRELQDIFEIQSDIAGRVAAALKIQLLSREKKDIEKRPTENLDAYQLHLKGRYHLNREQIKEEAKKALNYFEDAIKLDSRFALPYAGVSDYYHFASHMNWFSPEEAFPRMKEYATKALEIDPQLAEGHAALGAVYFHYDWNWRGAEREFARAIELRPSYDAVYEMYYYLLAVLGRFEESLEMAKRRTYISPEYGERAWGSNFAWAMIRSGIISQGVARLEEIVKADPDFAMGHNGLGFAYFQGSRHEDSISEVRKAVALSQNDLYFKGDLASILALSGQQSEASSILDELMEASKRTYVSNVQTAAILYNLGREDEAFDNLERAYKRRAIDLPDVRTTATMSKLRADPRWISIEKRMGLPPLSSSWPLGTR
jgi:TolB-like protein/Tfp pilus assembly protein PilF